MIYIIFVDCGYFHQCGRWLWGGWGGRRKAGLGILVAVIVIRSSQDCHREDNCQDDVDNHNEEHEGVLVKEDE